MDRKDHELGFTQWTLASAFGWSLKLNVWPKEVRHEPHDHRWSYISLPLGLFREARYRAVPGEHYAIRECFPWAKGRPVECLTVRTGLDLLFQRLRLPLIPYFCAAGQIHAFQPVRGPRLTLVLRFPPVVGSALVFASDEEGRADV